MDSMLPQPPPNQPEPSEPEPGAMDSRIKAKMIWWLGGLAIAFCGCWILAPYVIKDIYRRPAHRTEAISNVKQIGAMLSEFDMEYGQFPDAATIADVKTATLTPLTLGSATSNDLFRQCLVGGGGKSEKPFWAKTAISPKKADDVFGTDADTLIKGECGFAYIAGLSAIDDPATPVVMTSLLPGKLVFDRKAFDGKAVILRLDNSATFFPIEKDGRVMIDGMDIFDPRQSFWKGKKPDVKWPE
jgi:hypothetical protein